MKRLCWINLPHACFGVMLNSFGFVVEAAPIAGWMVHKHVSQVLRWVKSRGGELKEVG